MKVLKFGVSLHVNSPVIEMNNQMALERGVRKLECPAVVDINGKLLCNPSEILKAINDVCNNNHNKFIMYLLKHNIFQVSKTNVDIYNIDHYYPGSVNRSTVAILYGELGTAEFSKLHILLKKEAEKGSIDYVVRWYLKVFVIYELNI